MNLTLATAGGTDVVARWVGAAGIDRAAAASGACSERHLCGSGATPRVWLRCARPRRPPSASVATPLQLGGDFVVSAEGIVVYARPQRTDDRPPVAVEKLRSRMLAVGETVPSARLVGHDGDEVELLSAGQTTVVVFYRGDW